MLILNSVLPTEPVDQGIGAWPIVLMMFAVTLALVLLPMALSWLLDSEFYRSWVQIIMKCVQVVLVLACVAVILAVPFKVISLAETSRGVWWLFLGFVAIGVFAGFWFDRFEYTSGRAWWIAGGFIALCLIFAIVISIALAISALLAKAVVLPVGIVALMIAWVALDANK